MDLTDIRDNQDARRALRADRVLERGAPSGAPSRQRDNQDARRALRADRVLERGVPSGAPSCQRDNQDARRALRADRVLERGVPSGAPSRQHYNKTGAPLGAPITACNTIFRELIYIHHVY